jgi:uncharacterized protein YhbP (UPF0306 family)
MSRKIIDFFKKQTAASISCIDETLQPYSFSCFYAFDSENTLLYFKSSESSYHSRVIMQNPAVSGTVMPDRLNKLAVKGIQFKGEVLAMNDPLCKKSFQNYYNRFPLAVAIPGVIWTIRLDQLKMTNNIMGIFEKLSWQREQKENMEHA